MSENYIGLTKNNWTGTWAPEDNADYPIVVDADIRGSLHCISGDLGDRLSDIPAQRLKPGMLVYIRNEYTTDTVSYKGGKYYRYNPGNTVIDPDTGEYPNIDAYWFETSADIKLPVNNVGYLHNNGTGGFTYDPIGENTTMSVLNPKISDFTLTDFENNCLIPVLNGAVCTVPANLRADFVCVLIQADDTPIQLSSESGVDLNGASGDISVNKFDSVGLIKMVDGSFIVSVPNSVNQTIESLNDTQITTPSNGDTLKYDAVSAKWVNGPAGGAIAGATDAVISNLSIGDSLIWTGTNWVNGSVSAKVYRAPIVNNSGHLLPAFSTAASYSINKATGLITVSWASHPITAAYNGYSITLVTPYGPNRTLNPLGVPLGTSGYYADWCTNVTYVDANTFTCQSHYTDLDSMTGDISGASLLTSVSDRFYTMLPPIEIPANVMGPNGTIEWFAYCESHANGAPTLQFATGFGERDNDSILGFVSYRSSWTGADRTYGAFSPGKLNLGSNQGAPVSGMLMNSGSTDFQTRGHDTTSNAGIGTISYAKENFRRWDTTIPCQVYVGMGASSATSNGLGVVRNFRAVVRHSM